MAAELTTSIGRVTLKNPLIAGSGEHLIDAEGIRRALRAGVGAVVAKSANESAAAQHQLQCAEYMVLDSQWQPIPWNAEAPRDAFFACRSGLTPLPFDAWLDQTVALDREARAQDSYVVGSLILAELEPMLAMARRIEAAGLRVLEINIGTPYASQAGKGVVATELEPERVTSIVAAVRAAVSLPLWIKITGQSERVPELAAAAFAAGGEAVIMAGRSLGLIPDVESFAPMLGTTLGVGGHWNLPLTCQRLAMSRRHVGPDLPLIGTNGAQSGLDIARMMLAGASAVEMTSVVMLRGTGVLAEALGELDAYLARKQIAARELIGRAADQRRNFAEMPARPDNWRLYVTG